MTFSSELAELRFGYGLSPEVAPPGSLAEVLEGLSKPDEIAARFPIASFATFRLDMRAALDLRVAARKNRKDKALQEKVRAANQESVGKVHRWMANTMLRSAWAPSAFRERLVAFWADHFTAKGKRPPFVFAVSPYVEEAIRPNISGTFADLLIAAAMHPLMLHFLDQNSSAGPGSRIAQRNKKRSGLNENLAREVLELHTMGVGGPYSQDDVRQLAELFTGMSFNRAGEFVYRLGWAEPGTEQVLGRQYGGTPPKVEHIYQALVDLATHPVTADHIARKLVTHFVSDDPDPALVAHVATRFRASGGDLMQVYGALLEHPAAWAPDLRNVKPHIDYVASACRALAVRPKQMQGKKNRQVRRAMVVPLRVMGQQWQRPAGPDGWPEEDTAWATPQGISTRLRWAMSVPQLLRPDLPDPARFVETTLGGYANPAVRFAASAAESRPEAIGLVLSAPAFQRR